MRLYEQQTSKTQYFFFHFIKNFHFSFCLVFFSGWDTSTPLWTPSSTQSSVQSSDRPSRKFCVDEILLITIVPDTYSRPHKRRVIKLKMFKLWCLESEKIILKRVFCVFMWKIEINLCKKNLSYYNLYKTMKWSFIFYSGIKKCQKWLTT